MFSAPVLNISHVFFMSLKKQFILKLIRVLSIINLHFTVQCPVLELKNYINLHELFVIKNENKFQIINNVIKPNTKKQIVNPEFNHEIFCIKIVHCWFGSRQEINKIPIEVEMHFYFINLCCGNFNIYQQINYCHLWSKIKCLYFIHILFTFLSLVV